MLEKKCSKCGEAKLINGFYENKTSPTGLDSVCKGCRNKSQAIYREKNKETIRRKTAERRERVRKTIRSEDSERSKTDQRKYSNRVQKIFSLYGIREQEVRDLMDKQRGVCACCKIRSLVDPETYKSFSIDHDHRTGRVRGLLCNLCNTGIGALGDNVLGVKKALEYLIWSNYENK